MASERSILAQVLEKNQAQLMKDWQASQKAAGFAGDAAGDDRFKRFIEALRQNAAGGQFADISTNDWAAVRDMLSEISRERALKGATPSETAMFVFSLKQPLYTLLRKEAGGDADKLAREVANVSQLLDKLGLYTTEVFQKSREEVISRQQEELMELSTPVVQLWEGVIAVPLIGTLDSARTQVVMENLLQEIVTTGAEIAIIDITGVPTVDTLVAQHLLKTVSAARLMGADCIISGIRPQIAQTIVHLGVELDVISKATMADAFAVALRRIGKTVVDRKAGAQKAKNGGALSDKPSAGE
jgi:rsbT co-antagonist protein RsbR